jgi:pilus assembly protein CpaB
VAGFALPGNYVDVMVSAQQDRSGTHVRDETEQISKTVLTHVLVLAVAQEAGRDETKPKVVNAVTLELTPEDAEKLDLARNVGTLSLVLRNQIDNGNSQTAGVRKEDLLGPIVPVSAMVPAVKAPTKTKAAAPRRSEATPPASPAPKATVEIIRGLQKSHAELASLGE